MSKLSITSKALTTPHPARAGLTLIEMVSAMAIFMVIVGALIVGTNNAFDTWRGASTRTRSLSRGRAALALISDDLLHAVTLSNAFTFAHTAEPRPVWAFDEEDALWANRAEFDRAAPAPSAVGEPADGRVVWRLAAATNASLLIREILYATSGVSRVTEALDGVTRLRFAAIWGDPDAAAVTAFETNALPAAVDIFLELVPRETLRKAAGIADAESRKAFLARQTLPLAARVAFPHSRVPPLGSSTNIATLTGRVLQADGSGLAGIRLELAGGITGAESTQGGEGAYRISARQTSRPIQVTPAETGGRAGQYTPRRLTWWPAAGSRDGADFIWRESAITLSGKITRSLTGDPVEGVILDFPMAGQAVTGADGAYRIGVDSGWPYDGSTARVRPVHPRYPDSSFVAAGEGASGAAHLFTAVLEDQTGRDFVWFPPDLTLTGEVYCVECRAPLNGVRLRAEGDGITAQDYSADRGRYRISVPYGWSGRLTANWFWDDAEEEATGVFLDNHIAFHDLTESAFTPFAWRPAAVVSGEIYRASFLTNTVPVTIVRTSYTACLDRVEIPSGAYPGRFAAIREAAYTIAAPHQWYHSEEARVLFINPTNSLAVDGHGVYAPFYFVFATPPMRDAIVDFTWVPCELSVSGAVTNSLGAPVTNQAVLFLSNCIAIAPITNTVATNLADNLPVVIFNDPASGTATTNPAASVSFLLDRAFLFNASRHAFAELPWVYTADNGVYTNWVSLGWTGAVLPLDTNRTFTPPAVFVDHLTSNLTGVVFGGD